MGGPNTKLVVQLQLGRTVSNMQGWVKMGCHVNMLSQILVAGENKSIFEVD